MNVCVQGLWHLGTVTAACLASLGNRVVGFDSDPHVIDSLNRGVPPLFEPGLEALVKEGLDSGRLSFSSNPGEGFRDVQVLWIAHDTPVDENDEADVESVLARIEKTLPEVPMGSTVLISSQMP